MVKWYNANAEDELNSYNMEHFRSIGLDMRPLANGEELWSLCGYYAEHLASAEETKVYFVNSDFETITCFV